MEETANQHLEHAEHAGHAAADNNTFLQQVSATIAGLAVCAAIVASLEAIETSETIGEKNGAVLKQSQASDQWAFYQAKSMKQKMLEIAASNGHPKAVDFEKDIARYKTETKDIEKKAHELEHQRDEALESAHKHEHRHHGLTTAATLLHVAIAVATIAIITKGQKWPWFAALILGALGVVKAASVFLPG
jgi:Domain of unknown function (DUF4337)